MSGRRRQLGARRADAEGKGSRQVAGRALAVALGLSQGEASSFACSLLRPLVKARKACAGASPSGPACAGEPRLRAGRRCSAEVSSPGFPSPASEPPRRGVSHCLALGGSVGGGEPALAGAPKP